MFSDYIIERPTFKKLILASLTLAFLIFAAGWLTALLMSRQNDLLGRRGVPEIRTVPLASSGTPPNPTVVPDALPDDLKAKTDGIIRRLIDLGIRSPKPLQADGAAILFFTILDGGLWKTRIDDSLYRARPFRPTDGRDSGEPFYFTVYLDAFPSREEALEMVRLLRGKEYNPYVIPLSHGQKTAWHAVMLDDHDGVGGALQECRDFARKEKLPATAVYVESLSASPLRNLIGYAPEPEKPQLPDGGSVTLTPGPSESESADRGTDLAVDFGPYSLRIACYDTLETARKGMAIYGAKEGVFPYLVAAGKNRSDCGWIIYSGHFPDRPSTLKLKKDKGFQDAIVMEMPYTLTVEGVYSEEAAQPLMDRLNDDGFGPFTLPTRDGGIRLFCGIYPDEKTAEARQAELSRLSIDAEVTERAP